jgi:DNA polymerase Ligase (LigD)
MPSFVLLLHECPEGRPRPTHCDLMLEAGDTLQTWALSELPRDWRIVEGVAIAATNSVAAEQLADHRLAYLEYEGPVSGNRGTVKRLDAGTYENRRLTPDRLVVDAAGNEIRGEIELRRTAGNATQWQLSFRPHSPLAV